MNHPFISHTKYSYSIIEHVYHYFWCNQQPRSTVPQIDIELSLQDHQAVKYRSNGGRANRVVRTQGHSLTPPPRCSCPRARPAGEYYRNLILWYRLIRICQSIRLDYGTHYIVFICQHCIIWKIDTVTPRSIDTVTPTVPWRRDPWWWCAARGARSMIWKCK